MAGPIQKSMSDENLSSQSQEDWWKSFKMCELQLPGFGNVAAVTSVKFMGADG